MNQFNDMQNNQAPQEEEPQSLSLLGGIAGPSDSFADVDDVDALAGEAGRSINQNTLLVIAAIVIAVGSLYAMRWGQGELVDDSSSKKVEAKMEKILAKLSNPAAMQDSDPLREQNLQALFKDTDAIVTMLSVSHTENQVPVEYVQKNPFELAIVKAEEEALPKPANDRQRMQRLKELETELSRLQLQTVMKGKGAPIAIIGGEFYRPGATIGSFTITNVDASTLTVTLTAEGQQFVLSMQQKSRSRNRRHDQS